MMWPAELGPVLCLSGWAVMGRISTPIWTCFMLLRQTAYVSVPLFSHLSDGTWIVIITQL